MRFRKQRPWSRFASPRRRFLAAAATCWFVCSVTAADHERGQAEVILQGYYLSSLQNFYRISGLAFRFNEFIPNVGLLSGSLEGYAQDQNIKTGENYLELRDLVGLGSRWTLSGGDFHVSAALVEFPFYNLFYPDIAATGFKLEAARKDRQYQVFLGEETLPEGPRVPFRLRIPQFVLGASVRQQFGDRLQTGVRVLHFSSSATQIAQNPYFFPAGREFLNSTGIAAQSLYSIAKHLKLYGEATIAASDRVNSATADRSTSLLGGAVWDSTKVTARANYASLSASYLPLLGYFAGDRRGPFGEIRYRPVRSVEVFASASDYRNNLEHNPEVPQFRSQTASAGGSFRLPWRLSAMGQLSTIHFSASQPGAADQPASQNRQIAASVARPAGPHTVRFTLRDVSLNSPGRPEHQQSLEVEDVAQFKHFALGGAARSQRMTALERTNTLFFRAFGQARFGRFTVQANVEIGNDLLNRTVFATNAYSTTVISVSTPIKHGWDFQIEAFRNRLTTDLSPENIFLFGNQGIGVPNFIGIDQRSIFFRLVKRFSWGGPVPAGGLDQYAAAQTPLVGVVEGVVNGLTLAGPVAAEGIPVSLDEARIVSTDAGGRFRFTNVVEGRHRVMLDTLTLPADYDPGPRADVEVAVQPRRTTSAALNVFPLTALHGQLTASSSSCLRDVLVRLLPTARYTTTDNKGEFSFYNLREGNYEAEIDDSTLTGNCALSNSARVAVAIRQGAESLPLEFRLKTVQYQKAVRTVELDKKPN
jgi:hypothetical protein